MEHPLFATYGDRHANFLQSADDYHRQRHRVNKKLAKLRRSLKIHTRDTKNYSKREKTSSISSTEYAKDPRYADVYVWLCERDLLYCEETKLLLDVQSSKSKELFAKSKYKTSLKNAKKLLEIVKDAKNTSKLLEIYAYVSIIQGYYSLSHKKWSLSIYAFSVARCIIQFLYSQKTEEFQVPESMTKELYLELIDILIDPALKVCAAHSGNRSLDLLSLSRTAVNENLIDYLSPAIDIIRSYDESFVTNYGDRMVVDKDGEENTEAVPQRPLITSIQWSQYTASVKSEDVAKSIMDAQDTEALVTDSDLSSFDLPLSNWQDSISLHKQEMERASNDNTNADDDEDDQDKHIITTYLNYNYLLLRIRRDYSMLLSILNDDKKPKNTKSSTSIIEHSKNSIKVSESIINSIDEIKELSGVANDDDLFGSLECLKNYFLAIKVMKLSQGYLLSNKHKEALALIDRANQLIQSKEFSVELDYNLPTNTELSKLQNEVADSLKRTHILTVYHKEIGSLKSNDLILDNLNKCPLGQPKDILSRLATVEPKLLPVSIKPVLFDIGFNYINYQGEYSPAALAPSISSSNAAVTPATEEKANKPEAEAADEKKRGFFGMFGGRR